MAFVFEVEDGTGLSESNSYVSVLDADDYYSVDPYFAITWSALLTVAKQNLLAWATRVLDQKVVWEGTKTVDASALRWPRSGLVDRDGIEIVENIIPLQVVQATLELAKHLNASDITSSQDIEFLKHIRIDVLELDYQENVGQPALPSQINAILEPLGVIPMGGMRFVKIKKV